MYQPLPRVSITVPDLTRLTTLLSLSLLILYPPHSLSTYTDQSQPGLTYTPNRQAGISYTIETRTNGSNLILAINQLRHAKLG
jgi:hypothetical protein